MKRHKINEQIDAPRLRVIAADGGQLGILALRDALAEADNRNLDLVLMNENSDPPVAKLMEYNRFLYEGKKKEQQARRNQKNTQIKEIKFRPSTEEGDYQIKLRNIKRFIGDGNKVKVSVRFRGREIIHKDLGLELIDRITTDLTDLANVEQEAKLEGRQMHTLYIPAKGKK